MSKASKSKQGDKRNGHGHGSGHHAHPSSTKKTARPHPVAPPNDRNFIIALSFSLLIHALLLTLHFKFPEASRTIQDKALDIILVNSRSATKPTEAQALAQTNLDGGGITDQDRRAKTPLPATAKQQAGDEVEQAQKRVQALEARQQRLISEARSKGMVLAKPDNEAQPDPLQGLSGRDLANNAKEMIRLEGEIARDIDEYNKRPRIKRFGTRAKEYRFAQYIEDWRAKVERVGTINYPEAAKGKLYGTLILSVTIKSDGSIDKVEIDQSSGHKILDDAARRIVVMAGPYAPFSSAIRSDTDLLEITRTWSFTNNQLQTKNAQ